MKRLLIITEVLCICVFRATLVTEQNAKILVFMKARASKAHAKVPSLEFLSSLVGVSASSQEFKDVLRDYHCAENIKGAGTSA